MLRALSPRRRLLVLAVALVTAAAALAAVLRLATEHGMTMLDPVPRG
jgi:hypothetical protein